MAQLESIYQMGIKRKRQSSQIVLDLHFIKMACRKAPRMKGVGVKGKETKD